MDMKTLLIISVLLFLTSCASTQNKPKCSWSNPFTRCTSSSSSWDAFKAPQNPTYNPYSHHGKSLDAPVLTAPIQGQ